jgi:hypothetical protein
MIVTFFLTDIIAWALAGIFVLWGMFWEPAYVIAGCIVLTGIFYRMRKRKRYVCFKCKREYTYDEVRGR